MREARVQKLRNDIRAVNVCGQRNARNEGGRGVMHCLATWACALDLAAKGVNPRGTRGWGFQLGRHGFTQVTSD